MGSLAAKRSAPRPVAPSGRRLARALMAAGTVAGILVVATGRIAPDPEPPLTLRFVTFNLLHGGIFSELTGDDQQLEERLRLAARELRALDADVIGLQEASTGRRRGDVAARLARALGYHHVYAPAATRPLGSEHLRRGVAAVLGFTEGPALLSRVPIRRWRAYQLPACGRPFDVRVIVLAELETPLGPLAAFSAHTSGDPCHARAVADIVRANAGPLPAVVMGDFNAPAGSPAFRILTREAALVDAYGLLHPDAPGFTDGQDVRGARATARQRIDYVFLARGQVVPGRVVGSQVVLGEPQPAGRVRWPSDHYGVLADIALDRPAAPERRPVEASTRPGRAGG